MPQARDRILGELAVEQGLLTRGDADRYYSLLDSSPGSPPLSQLLLRDRRATAQDLVRLRDIWQDRQARGNAASGLAPPSPRPGSGAFGLPAPTPPPSGAFRLPPGVTPTPASGAFRLPPGATPPPSGAFRLAPGATPTPSSGAFPSTPPRPVEPESLKRDDVLARILIARRVLTTEQAREARALQLKHNMRFGPVILRKGFVDRAVLDDAIRYLREWVVLCASCGTPHEKAKLGNARACPRCQGPLVPAVSDDATPLWPTNVTPRPIAPPLGGAPRPGPGPGGEDPEGVTIAGGIMPPDLLRFDPFASVGARGGQAPAPVAPPAFAAPPPFAAGPPGAPRPLGIEDSRAALLGSGRYGSGARPMGPQGPPPPVRDASLDELEIVVPLKPEPAINVSVDELNPFATTPLHGPGVSPPSNAPSEFGLDPLSGYGLAPPPVDPGPPGAFGEAPTIGLPSGSVAEGTPVIIPSSTREDVSGSLGLVPADTREEPESESSPEPSAPAREPAGSSPARARADRSNALKGGPPPRKSSAKLVLAILLGLAIAGGALAFVGLWVAKSRRVDRNLQAGDEAVARKDFPRALASYEAVLVDSPENPDAQRKRDDCAKKVDELTVENEALSRIKKSQAPSTSAPDAIKVLTEDAPDSKLNDDQKRRVAARLDVQLAVVRAHERNAFDLVRKAKDLDAARAKADAGKLLENLIGASDAPPVEALLERIRWLDKEKVLPSDTKRTLDEVNREIQKRLDELQKADAEGWCGAYARGRLAVEARTPRPDEAISQLEAALGKAPDPTAIPEAYLYRGKAKLLLSRPPSDVKKDLQAAADAAPTDPRPWVELAKLTLDTESDTSRADTIVQQAAQRSLPQDPEVLAVQGEVQAALKDWTRAMPTLDAALKRDGSNVRARRARAKAWVHLNPKNDPTPEFQQDLELAIGRYPDDVELASMRGSLRWGLKDWPGAIQDFSVYLKKFPDDVDILFKRSIAYLNKNEYDEALGDLNAMLAKNGSDERALGTKGIALLLKRDYASAVEAFNAVFKLPTLRGSAYDETFYHRGCAYMGARKYKEAIDDFGAYLQKEPTGKFAAEAKRHREECVKLDAQEKK